ncbi:hypothetical protein JZX87_26680 [Agrobacterium sp. Ap1]|uniref:hypothetical protein n=1 Tax=Rhizobium/Agrobacterium group TaxID=227290 RepID=UPI001A8E7C0D|nr:hypothetical protein [Agrobacterium sp. Ap1]MBO0144738.1 hypothetical protein [Agrobacterium sp. Ap1]
MPQQTKPFIVERNHPANPGATLQSRRSGEGWMEMDDAHGFDRRQHQHVCLRRRLRLAHAVKVFLQSARVSPHDLQVMCPFEAWDRHLASPSCLHFSRGHPPNRRAAGLPQLRPSIAAAPDKRGS